MNRSILGVSGGPDSVYLVHKQRDEGAPVLLAHFNHRARGKDSENDELFVRETAAALGIPVEVGRGRAPRTRFEEEARTARYAFFKELMTRTGAARTLVAHTADDQVETVLMRVFEGAGISGLKGIPRAAADGVERPLLDTWRDEILVYLRANKIPYRIDKSNEDVRFERNWIRHVLLPLLEKRYGKAIRKRIHALGERFREVDEYLEDSARKFLKRNTRIVGGNGSFRGNRGGLAVPRKSYSRRPAALRKKALQLICFERLGVAPNERLLASMDEIVRSGGPSARLALGKGATLRCRYGEAIFSPASGETTKTRGARQTISVEERGRIAPGAARRLSAGERAAVFDAGALRLPISVRPLRAGDRIRPFGLDADKKVKEILIDRKVPQDERWGRPVVCDAEGEILWIPGVLRSAHAPVASRTRLTVILRTVR